MLVIKAQIINKMYAYNLMSFGTHKIVGILF